MWTVPFLLTRLSEDLSAGFPSAAEGYEDEPLNLHTFLVRNPAATFFFRVADGALSREHLRDGSILVVDRSVTPTAGRLVLTEVLGEFQIVRFVPGTPTLLFGVVTAVVTRLP